MKTDIALNLYLKNMISTETFVNQLVDNLCLSQQQVPCPYCASVNCVGAACILNNYSNGSASSSGSSSSGSVSASSSCSQSAPCVICGNLACCCAGNMMTTGSGNLLISNNALTNVTMSEDANIFAPLIDAAQRSAAKTCTDCKGKKVYHGFNKTEPCALCKGSGII